MSTMHTVLEAMAPEVREALLAHSHQVTFPAGNRIFKERRRAEEFWIILSGTVDLGTHIPCHKDAVIDTLGYGELLGWSWMVPPYSRRLGATASHEVRALDFDAVAVRELRKEDSAVGRSVSVAVAAVIADRLDPARTRLLDLFAPHGSGTPLSYAPEDSAMTSTPYTVADVMTTKVIAVTPTTGFKDIAAAMKRWKVTALPVVEGEGHVVGVVSEADLLPKEEFHEHGPGLIEQMRRLGDTAKAGSTSAENLMTSPAVTIRPNATLPQAARIMTDRRIKRLPVVDADGTLKGIVSRADLLKVFLRTDEELTDEIRRSVIERLFPISRGGVTVTVTQGIATLTGSVRDGHLIPMAERLARAVEGVVDVRCRLEARTAA
ncbi:CBS domain-containing protein [Streptomyces sp. NPDC059533]|uniref:CBS domain-containing protein n=1 Tax=unclassified Streptomyces TaxID=2593676 RepID=UPI003691ADC0